MNIFVDESGTFVSAPRPNSWNVVAAYVTPEFERRRIEKALAELHRDIGVRESQEIKLRDASERDYFKFLASLGELRGVAFAVVSDASIYSDADIVQHRDGQAAKVVEHIDVMQFESGRRGLQALSEQISALAPQLYIQLQCQVQLIFSIMRLATLYFVQTNPKTLGNFRWRIDQKNATRTSYEDAFFKVLLPLLQTMSLEQPLSMLEGADYSAFRRFEYPEGKSPTYLKTVYGININTDHASLNIGKLIQENLSFVDSRQSYGVQIADLLAAGLRRTLRAQFSDNRLAARLLGSIMLCRLEDEPPVQLVGFTGAVSIVDEKIGSLVGIMKRNCRSIVAT